MTLRQTLALFAASLPLAAPFGFAQENPDGPTALITTFRTKPESRVQFRKIMATEGVAQMEKWKQAGVFASYRALFTTYAGDNAPDMYLIVRFNHFTDLSRWQKIEETSPGGLPSAAQAIAWADSSATADIVKENAAAPTTPDSQFFVLEYDVLADMPKYESYVVGYATPQFDAWEKTGALSSYASYVNQNPAGAPWSSFMVLEYKDLKSLAQREVIKTQTRKNLAATNPAWKTWSEDKTKMRTEKAAIPVRALNQP